MKEVATFKFYVSSYFGEFIGIAIFATLIIWTIVIAKNEFFGIKTKMQKRVFRGFGVLTSAFIAMLSAHLTHQTHGWLNPAFAMGYGGKDLQDSWAPLFRGYLKEGIWFGMGLVTMEIAGVVTGTITGITSIYAFNALTTTKVINFKETFTWTQVNKKGFKNSLTTLLIAGSLIGLLLWATMFGAYESNLYTDDGSEVRNWHDGYVNNHQALKFWGTKQPTAAELATWHITAKDAVEINGKWFINQKFDTTGQLLWIIAVAAVYGIVGFFGGTRKVMLFNPALWIANFIITLFAQRRITRQELALELWPMFAVWTFAFAGGLISHGLIHDRAQIV